MEQFENSQQSASEQLLNKIIYTGLRETAYKDLESNRSVIQIDLFKAMLPYITEEKSVLENLNGHSKRRPDELSSLETLLVFYEHTMKCGTKRKNADPNDHSYQKDFAAAATFARYIKQQDRKTGEALLTNVYQVILDDINGTNIH